MKKLFITLIILMAASLTAPLLGAAQDPMETIQGPINEVLLILQSKSSKGTVSEKERIRAIINDFFDFTEISRRALARNWKKFSPDEKTAFIRIFSELLSNTYINQMQGGFENDTVIFISSEKIKENQAVVRTKIIRVNIEIPLDYRLKKKNDSWAVYDIKVEGISLVKNYRGQFKKILARKSPAHLIDLLKKKVAK